MINVNNPQDAMLKERINAIFKRYDTNHSGTLSLQELHVFLNDLLASTGNARRVTQQEAQNVMRAIDMNGDGRINKYEMFHCFKYLTNGANRNGHGPANHANRVAIPGQQAKGLNRPPAYHNNQQVNYGYGPTMGGVAVAPGMMGVAPMLPMAYTAPMVGIGFGMPIIELDMYGPMGIGLDMFDW